MQHLANKVGSVIVKHNRDDMKEIRENIVEENEMCGFENPNLVNVESDARNTNPIHSSGVTPFQAEPKLFKECVKIILRIKK